MTRSEQAETRERRFIGWWLDKHPLIESISISEIGDKERSDFRFMYQEKEHIGEVKIRTFEYDKYDTIIIEMDKINDLLKDAVKTKGRVIYFAVYPESRCYFIIDVMKIPNTISYEHCPKATVEDIGMKNKVMLNFKLSDCEPYKFTY